MTPFTKYGGYTEVNLNMEGPASPTAKLIGFHPLQEAALRWGTSDPKPSQQVTIRGSEDQSCLIFGPELPWTSVEYDPRKRTFTDTTAGHPGTVWSYNDFCLSIKQTRRRTRIEVIEEEPQLPAPTPVAPILATISAAIKLHNATSPTPDANHWGSTFDQLEELRGEAQLRTLATIEALQGRIACILLPLQPSRKAAEAVARLCELPLVPPKLQAQSLKVLCSAAATDRQYSHFFFSAQLKTTHKQALSVLNASFIGIKRLLKEGKTTLDHRVQAMKAAVAALASRPRSSLPTTWSRAACLIPALVIGKSDADISTAMNHLLSTLVGAGLATKDDWHNDIKRSISDCIKIFNRRAPPLPSSWDRIAAIIYKPPEGMDTSPLLHNYASWTGQGIPATNRATTRIGAWNVDGLLDAWFTGQLQRMIEATNLDILHLSEIRCSMTDILQQTGGELKTFLASKGFNAYFYWCDNPGGQHNMWGTALLSRLTPTKIQYGFGKGHEALDDEGRFILANYSGFAVEGSYVPCSGWHATEQEPKRMEFDNARLETCKGIENLISVGDNNCAKNEGDSTVCRNPETTPGRKVWELRNMTTFLETCKLSDVYTKLNGSCTTADLTWARTPADFRRGVGMRIDHIHVSNSFFTGEAGRKFISCSLGKSFYKSDHRPIIAVLGPDCTNQTHAATAEKLTDCANQTHAAASEKPTPNCTNQTQAAAAEEPTPDPKNQTHAVPTGLAIAKENQIDAPASIDPGCENQTHADPTIQEMDSHPGTGGSSRTTRRKAEPRANHIKPRTNQPPKPTGNKTCDEFKIDEGKYLDATDGWRNITESDVDDTDKFFTQWSTSVAGRTAREPGRHDDDNMDCTQSTPRDQDKAHEPMIPTSTCRFCEDDEIEMDDDDHYSEDHASPVDLNVSTAMPILRLDIGKSREGHARQRGCTILADTGCLPNCISKDMFDKLHLATIPGDLPVFQMLNGTKSRPQGLCELPVWLNNHTSICIHAYVVPGQQYDVVIGSSEFRARKAILNYKSCHAIFEQKGHTTRIPFTMEDVQVKPMPLYAAKTLTIDPGQHVIDLVTPTRTQEWRKFRHADDFDTNKEHQSSRQPLTKNPDTRWGLVTGAGYKGAMIQTMKLSWTGERTKARIFNYTAEPIVIKQCTQIASFTPGDSDYYDIIEEVTAEPQDIHDQEETIPTSSFGGPPPPLSADSKSQLDKIEIGKDWDLEPHQISGARALCEKYADIFQQPSLNTKCLDKGIAAKLRLTADANYIAKSRPTNPAQRAALTPLIADQLRKGIITKSNSGTTSPVLLVPKPGGKWRFCVDYTHLNKVTESDAYSVPRIDEYFTAMGGNKYFSTFDLVDAFWSVPLHKDSQELTAFTCSEGLFHYQKMPQGIKQGPAIFSRFIDQVFSGLKWEVCVTYIDDVVVYTRSYESHMKALENIFSRVREYGLFFKPEKCKIMTKELKFLGHIVSHEGINLDPDKAKAVCEMPQPTTRKQLRSTLGFFGYFRKYIKDYSRIVSPLQVQLRGSTVENSKAHARGRVDWTSAEARKSWKSLITALTTAPILTHPDWGAPFIVHVDACNHGLGATLTQKHADGRETVVMYASKSLTEIERRYQTWELEAYACVWAVTSIFRQYLLPPYGRRFTIFTDSSAVAGVFNPSRVNGFTSRVAHWKLRLSEYDYEIRHRAGVLNLAADHLSRCSLTSTCPYGERQ
jgi:exodeoxyribonuclease III